MVKLVERMLDQHKQLPEVNTPRERESVVLRSTQFLRSIAAMDKQIDVLVYKLCGLTEDEVRVVEGAAK